MLVLWHDYCIAGSWSIQPFRSNTLLIANWLCFLLEIYWWLAGQLPGSSLPNIGGMFPNMLPFGVAGQVIPFFNVFYLIKTFTPFIFIFIMPGALDYSLLFCDTAFVWISSIPLSSSHKQWLSRYGSLVLNILQLSIKVVPTSFPFRLLVMLGVFMSVAFLHLLMNRSIYLKSIYNTGVHIVCNWLFNFSLSFFFSADSGSLL